MAIRNVEALSTPLYIGNGSNRAKFSTDGTVSLEGTATAYNDITGNINGSSLYSTAGKADYDWSEDFVVLQPGGSLSATGDIINIKYQLRHDMKAGTPLKLHIHWRQTNATTVFSYVYRVQDNGAAVTSAWSAAINVAATGAANAFSYASGTLNQITILGDIPTVGVGLSGIVQVKLTRTDATTGDVIVYDVDAHYEVDSFGSADQYSR